VQKKSSFTVAEVQKKLEHYCAYQERCHWEVEQKLKSYGMIPEAREVILTQLIQDNFLNETRFAQSFARGKFRIKNWGKQRIVRELKARYISDFNIKIALKEIPEQEYNTAFWNLFQKKKLAVNHLPIEQQKKKIAALLLYRGWESEKVYEALTSISQK
jgi:regulatory protein